MIEIKQKTGHISAVLNLKKLWFKKGASFGFCVKLLRGEKQGVSKNMFSVGCREGFLKPYGPRHAQQWEGPQPPPRPNFEPVEHNEPNVLMSFLRSADPQEGHSVFSECVSLRTEKVLPQELQLYS